VKRGAATVYMQATLHMYRMDWNNQDLRYCCDILVNWFLKHKLVAL